MDLKEFFFILSYHQMKLNPSKCVFAIKGGKDVGFLVSFKGIKPNPKTNSIHTKYDSSLDCEGSSTSYKEINYPQSIHSLTGRMHLAILQDLEEHNQL
jgi:hypothetical protein